MGLMDSEQPSPRCFRRHRARAVSFPHSRVLMHAIPERAQHEVAAEWAGIWTQATQESALLNLAASTREIPEALSRSHSEPVRR
jgi:hypothetical protein